MHALLLILLLAGLLLGPGLWVRRVMRRYSEPGDRYAVSGGELARRLLDEEDMTEVRVEITEQGDHYDPVERVIRLTPEVHDRRSLTAVTVAAHEVGHAIQDAQAYRPLRVRTRLIRLVRPLERLGAGILLAAPLVAVLSRAPLVTAATLVGGLLALGTATLVHLVTLPTELDASFRRALPLLEHKEVLWPADRPHARRILRAAALTYVAASLMSLLNIARWWALLRR